MFCLCVDVGNTFIAQGGAYFASTGDVNITVDCDCNCCSCCCGGMGMVRQKASGSFLSLCTKRICSCKSTTVLIFTRINFPSQARAHYSWLLLAPCLPRLLLPMRSYWLTPIPWLDSKNLWRWALRAAVAAATAAVEERECSTPHWQVSSPVLMYFCFFFVDLWNWIAN
jgi:hypothetical protein